MEKGRESTPCIPLLWKINPTVYDDDERKKKEKCFFFLCFAANFCFLFIHIQCQYPIVMGLDFQIENVVIDILSVVIFR